MRAAFRLRYLVAAERKRSAVAGVPRTTEEHGEAAHEVDRSRRVPPRGLHMACL